MTKPKVPQPPKKVFPAVIGSEDLLMSFKKPFYLFLFFTFEKGFCLKELSESLTVEF